MVKVQRLGPQWPGKLGGAHGIYSGFMTAKLTHITCYEGCNYGVHNTKKIIGPPCIPESNVSGMVTHKKSNASITVAFHTILLLSSAGCYIVYSPARSVFEIRDGTSCETHHRAIASGYFKLGFNKIAHKVGAPKWKAATSLLPKDFVKRLYLPIRWWETRFVAPTGSPWNREYIRGNRGNMNAPSS